MKRTVPPAVRAVLDAIEALPPEERVLAIQLAVADLRPPRPSRGFARIQPRVAGGWMGRDLEPRRDPAA